MVAAIDASLVLVRLDGQRAHAAMVEDHVAMAVGIVHAALVAESGR